MVQKKIKPRPKETKQQAACTKCRVLDECSPQNSYFWLFQRFSNSGFMVQTHFTVPVKKTMCISEVETTCEHAKILKKIRLIWVQFFFFSFLKLKANCKHTRFLWRGIWVSKLLQWYCKLWIRMPVCKEGLLWSSCLTYSLCRQFQTGKMEESKLLKPCSLQQWINFKC